MKCASPLASPRKGEATPSETCLQECSETNVFHFCFVFETISNFYSISTLFVHLTIHSHTIIMSASSSSSNTTSELLHKLFQNIPQQQIVETLQQIVAIPPSNST